MNELLLAPPIAVLVFLAVACGIYRLGARPGPRDASDKYLPYTGGEQPLPLPPQQGYHVFFRLALLFSILHVATLVLSTLPRDLQPRRTALIYLAGIAISVFALTERKE
jgi:NADH:ubiquinone oxidoreductase subunit 3 (subunit A)